MEYNVPSITATVTFGCFVAAGYVAAYIAFANDVVGNYEITNGYPRDDLKPGTFVSDRYGYGWFFLMFTLCKGVVPFVYLYSLYDFVNHFKRVLFDALIGWAFVVDLALGIFFLVVSCAFCNNNMSAGSPCNAPLPQWCAALGPIYPDRCKPGPVTIEECNLSVNPLFVDWLIFAAVFTILDVLLYLLNQDMEYYINQYIYAQY